MEPSALPPNADLFSVILLRVIRAAIYFAAFLVPLLSIPLTRDTLLVKPLVVESVALIVGAAWLLEALLKRRVIYRRSPFNMVLGLTALVMLVSMFASNSPWSSFWGSDPTGEKAASMIAFIVIVFVAAAVFRPSDIARTALCVVIVYLLLDLLVLGSLFGGRLGLALPDWMLQNPLGTVNASAVVLAAGFLMTLVFSFVAGTPSGRRLVARPVLFIALLTAFLLGATLLLIGFRMVWGGIAAAMALLLAANFSKRWTAGEEAANEYAFGSLAAAIGFLVLLIALFFAVWPGFLIERDAPLFIPPLEISPSFGATLAIGREVLKADPVFGLGPSNFHLAFNQFRDTSLNQSLFWQVRFSHGFSFLSTVISTLGIAGVLIFLALVLSGMFLVGRTIFRSESPSPYLWSFGALAVFVFIEWFLYASNFTATFLALLSLGLVMAAAQEPRGESSGVSYWRVARRTVLVEGVAVNFAASLVVVSAAAFCLIGLYALGTAYAAEVLAKRALQGAAAVPALEHAIRLNPNDASFRQLRAEAALGVVSRLITEAAVRPSQDLSGQFRTEFGNGIAAVNAAIALEPADPRHWVTLGGLYETVIPFIPGAERAATDAYAKAVGLDPLDPLLRLARGRSALAAADTVSLQASRSEGEERNRLDGLYKEFLGRCRQELEAAINLKPDLAAAHFLLAQVHLREGNLPQAIRNVEATAVIAPGDIGVAFQLGFLYYRNGDFVRAEREFQRAIVLDENYSNARYFLGLIYDRRGDRASALSEFKKIAALNPDNDEVKRIIANLSANRRALDGIAPPPEARRDVPIAEQPARRR